MPRLLSGPATLGVASASGTFSFLRASAFGLCGLATLAFDAQAVPITPGNLVVVRVGDGSGPLASASTAVFLDEYTQAGVFVQTIALPIAAAGSNNPFTNSGTASSEGYLNLSANGQYLVHAGYGVAPGTASVATTLAPATPRVISRVDLAGNVDTSTLLTDTSFSGSNVRSATSNDGLQFWAAGTTSTVGGVDGGVRYITALGAATSAQVSASVTNTRVVQLFNGQLYVSTASGAFNGVNTVGTGLEQGPSATTVLLTGFPGAATSKYDYFFADAQTLYVADDGTAGGIEKWTESAGTWTKQYTLATTTTPVGCRGLTGVVNAGVATLFATTTQTNNNIVTVTDTGVGSVVSILVGATANMAFRGIRVVGSTAVPATPYCFGDGTGTLCPCHLAAPPGGTGPTGPGAPGNGCPNSVNAAGANLASTGSASLSNDTIALLGTGMPNSSALYFQGTGQQNGGLGSAFGDGLRCAAGSIIRLGTKTNAGGASQYPTGGDLSVSVKGLVGGPGVRHYQCWYRNAALYCVATSTFNLTNGLTLTWSN